MFNAKSAPVELCARVHRIPNRGQFACLRVPRVPRNLRPRIFSRYTTSASRQPRDGLAFDPRRHPPRGQNSGHSHAWLPPQRPGATFAFISVASDLGIEPGYLVLVGPPRTRRPSCATAVTYSPEAASHPTPICNNRPIPPPQTESPWPGQHGMASASSLSEISSQSMRTTQIMPACQPHYQPWSCRLRTLLL